MPKTTPRRPTSDSGSLGQFYRSRERMIHLAAPIGHRPNPDFNSKLAVSPLNPQTLPFVIKLGKAGTLNLGRNAAKRAKRAMGAW